MLFLRIWAQLDCDVQNVNKKPCGSKISADKTGKSNSKF